MINYDPMDEGLSSPVVAGLLLGLIMIGPDHLGTLMALSTLTTGFEAAKVGILWGFGHSIGMILLVPPFMLLEKFSVKAANMTIDQWEYWGDYFIGASMIIVAIYFCAHESKYLEEKADGTYVARSCCSCHPHFHNPADGECQAHDSDHDCDCDCEEQVPLLAEEQKDISISRGSLRLSPHYKPCSPADRQEESDASCCHSSCQSCPEHARKPYKDCQENTPLLRDKATSLSWLNTWLAWSARDARSAVLGVFQGLCCPMALMGIGFMGKMASAEMSELAIFTMVFMAASGLGSGMLTLCWGFLSSNGLTSCVSPLIVFRFVNFFTLALGVIWIVANAAGLLHYVNFMEGMHTEHFSALQTSTVLSMRARVGNAAGLLHYGNFTEGMHPAVLTGETGSSMPMK